MQEGLGQAMETKADTNSLPSNSEDLLAKARLILRKPQPPPAAPLSAKSESSFSVNFSPPPGTENVADAGIIIPRDRDLSPPAPEKRTNSLPSNSEDLLAKARLILRTPQPLPALRLSAKSESSFSVNFNPPPGTENVADAGIIIPRDRDLSPPAPEKRLSRRRPKAQERRNRMTTVVTGDYDPNNDGCTWRKYGEKVIFGDKYPSHYYRCEQRFPQPCSATKRVQKSDDNPPIFIIEHLGKHTCIGPSKSSQLEQPKNQMKRKFESGNGNSTQPLVFSSTQEYVEGEHSPALSTDISTGHSGSNFASGMRLNRKSSSLHQPESCSLASVQDSCSPESSYNEGSTSHTYSEGGDEHLQEFEPGPKDNVAVHTSAINLPAVSMDLGPIDFVPNFPERREARKTMLISSIKNAMLQTPRLVYYGYNP